MPIEFTVRTDDLRRAVKQLQVTRGQFADTDSADLTVSAFTLGVKAVGTETTLAANGKQSGTARLPLKILVRVADLAKTYHQRESTILIDEGYAKVGRTKTSHPDISVGSGGFEPASIPPNASALDTLAVASMMTPEQIANAGLRGRVETAQQRVSAAVRAALSVLKEFGLTAQDITQIIDKRVEEAAQIIRKAARE
jgi:hypothetical protein